MQQGNLPHHSTNQHPLCSFDTALLDIVSDRVAPAEPKSAQKLSDRKATELGKLRRCFSRLPYTLLDQPRSPCGQTLSDAGVFG